MAVIGVTGATGLIGTEFLKLARIEGHDLRPFSRNLSGTARIDLTQSELDPHSFIGCDAIVHLAARLPSSGADIAEARECFEVNVLGTLKLMDAMRLAGVLRLIHATAANAYAPWCEFPDEKSPLYPLSRSYYLGSKVSQELYAHAYGAAHGLEVTSLRVSSPYGPSSRSAVGRMAKALLQGEAVQLENGGMFGADFVQVSDVAQAILLVERLKVEGVFNVASGVRTRILEIAALLARMTGRDPSLLGVQPGEPLAFQGFPAINIGKIRALGFVPTDLEMGLAMTLEELTCSASISPR